MIVKVLTFAALSAAIPIVLALGLILSQRPKALDLAGGLDFTGMLQKARDLPQPISGVKMCDGYLLQVRLYPSESMNAPLLVLVHSSGWHGLQFDALARRLGTVTQVVVPDLRGHGAKPGTRGDITHIGQFEDDIADLIENTRRPEQAVVMGGHSSGGGFVVRFAGGQHGQMIDGAVLLAPFLKHDAPTTRPDSGVWASVLRRRIIGLNMLNSVGIRALNYLKIIQFRMPQAVLDGPFGDTATTAYSFRLNTSYAPRPYYLSDLAALPRFLVLAGSKDEAFDAAAYEPTISAVTDRGRFSIVPDVGHLDVVDAQTSASQIAMFLNEF